MSVFNLPDLGEGLREAEILEWHVAAGDEVAIDAPLVSVETDKAIVEIPSPRDGRVARLCAAPGDILQTGRPLLEFSGTEDRGTVVGEVRAGEATLEESPLSLDAGSAARIKATPGVRALARRLEVDLSLVSPSGQDGMVTRADVERVAARLRELGPPELLRGARRAMVQSMERARAEVVPATLMDDADIDHWPVEVDFTVRLIRALVAGCRAEPSLNAWFDRHSMGRRVLEKIDVAMATDTPDGLFIPVLRDVAGRDDADLRGGLEAMKEATRTRTIPAQEMRGHTIMLSNFGTIAGRYAAPVVIPPSVAILGAGRAVKRATVHDGEIAARRQLPLVLTFDHRAVTGGEAGRFLNAVIADLQS